MQWKYNIHKRNRATMDGQDNTNTLITDCDILVAELNLVMVDPPTSFQHRAQLTTDNDDSLRFHLYIHLIASLYMNILSSTIQIIASLAHIMETVMNHGQLLYSLGQPWTTFTHTSHLLGRKRIHLRRRSRLHWAFQPQTRGR